VRIVTQDQGSAEWEVWRSKGIGASDAPVILNLKHFQTTLRHLWEEKVAAYHGLEAKKKSKRPAPSKTANTAMQMGRDAEPGIREWYEGLVGEPAPALCVIHDTLDWLRASLDGWLAGRKVALEVKRPGMRWDGTCDHYDALGGRVPPKYLSQLDHQFLVTDADEIHYVSYGDPKHFPEDQRHVLVVVERDRGREQELLALETEFWKAVVDRDADYVERRTGCPLS
jgi:putative phage-type endonuclease